VTLARREWLTGLGAALAGCAVKAQEDSAKTGKPSNHSSGEGGAAGSGGTAGSPQAGSGGSIGGAPAGGTEAQAGGSTATGGSNSESAFGPAQYKEPIVASSTLIERIAFGSCIRMFPSGPERISTNQGWWTHLNARLPQVFMFLGDNVYIDIGERYEDLAKVPGFQECMATTMPLPVWDDHDFGKDNQGANYLWKDIVKEAFLDFWSAHGGIPKETARRTRAGNYDSLILGPAGQEVQFLMLDCRYFADDSTTLGEDQWTWLEAELQKPAKLRFVEHSIPIDRNQELDRFFQLVSDTGANGVIVVSGETHNPKITEYSDGPYTITDFTSSSISQGGNPNFAFATIDWGAADPTVNIEFLSAESGTQFDGRLLSFSALGS
jgi:alkaline phosphatase D